MGSDVMIDSNIGIGLDADGILLAAIDMPGRTMNVFSRGLIDALEKLIAEVEGDDSIRGVVLTSGKSAFLAGADLEMIRVFTERAQTDTPAQLHDLCGHLGRLFRRMELSSKPYVAAINGLALGGGLELCLACHERVVVDNASVQLGLPEIKLGLLPGAGGTQRLPRLIGPAKGLQMLLTGEAVAPRVAQSLGLVDEVVVADQLILAAKRRAKALLKSGAPPQSPWDRPGASFDDAPFGFSESGIVDTIAKAVGIGTYQLAHYPAYNAIIACVVGGWRLPMTAASIREMDIFVELIRNPVAGNMVRTLFLNRQKAAKLGLLGSDSVLAKGDGALLPRVRAAREKAQALRCDEATLLLVTATTALGHWAQGDIDQPDLADVAVVNAGLFPSYAGGPFNYLRQTNPAALRTCAAAAEASLRDWLRPLSALDRFLGEPQSIAA